MTVLDAAQGAMLRAVLNCLVPARTDLPGAGDLDVGASIESSLAGSIGVRRLFLDGLDEIAISSDRQFRRPFGELDSAGQTAVLETVEREHPAFFAALVEHTYRGYYTLPAVHAAIGFESRPPQPLGHQLAPFDPALLEGQRLRAPFWRLVDLAES
jgi:hypothetical protein